MKKYGIYLAYPPTVDLRHEGLGRHLAEFLRGARERGDIEFVIACPSWMRENLLALFEGVGLTSKDFEFISPERKPLIFVVYDKYQAYKARTKKDNWFKQLTQHLRKVQFSLLARLEKRAIATRSIAGSMLFGSIGFLMVVAYQIWRLLRLVFILPRRIFASLCFRLSSLLNVQIYFSRLETLTRQPKDNSGVMRMFQLMLEAETSLMLSMINARKDIAAWYSPTAFWPHFNEIAAPRLMCVPDVVLADFPVGFAPVGGQRFLENFKQVEKAILGGAYFTTYSSNIKWSTLVKRYHIDPQAIFVITHGANRLDDLVLVAGTSDNEATTDALCRNLFRTALRKAVNNGYAANYGGDDLRYIFYASQFRPNKNIMTLLKAYEFLLKKRYIGYKLVLTGNPNVLPEVGRFIAEHNLENDVLCLHGLSARELAACYRLADLAVNPSLSEGGFPFTFTEALSVDTPVMMARIPVTEEIIVDCDLQARMLFDPYDWKDMANQIEWGLNNHQLLLAQQKPFYEQLAQRTWRNVVDEYVEVLDRISATPKAEG